MMNELFVEEFIEIAEKNEIRDLVFYHETIEKMEVNIFEGDVEQKQLSKVTTCYVEGNYNGNKGYIYIENFDPKFYQEYVKNIIEIANCLKIPFKESRLSVVLASDFVEVSDGDKFEKILLEAERKALESNLVKKVSRCYGAEVIKKIVINDSHGYKMEDIQKSLYMGIEVAAEKDGIVQTAVVEVNARDSDDIYLDELLDEACCDASNLIDAKSIKSGKYRVILKNSVVSELLDMYITSFAGDSIRKKLSRLSGMVYQKIASDNLNLKEIPNFSKGVNCRLFDDEGIKTLEKDIIKNGKLLTFLYNKEEAELVGKKSTGNGFKHNYKSIPSIKVTNLKLSGGNEISKEKMIEMMGDGLYITSCDGIFAGADPISGDFSLISKGYLIKDGVKVSGVNQITIAGNFFDMIKDIKEIGDDHKIGKHSNGVIISPSLYISSLVISGL